MVCVSAAAHVRRHVVGPLFDVAKQRVAIRHEAREEALEVAQHLRVRVLLDQQAGRRVGDEHGDEARPNAALGVQLEHAPR